MSYGYHVTRTGRRRKSQALYLVERIVAGVAVNHIVEERGKASHRLIVEAEVTTDIRELIAFCKASGRIWHPLDAER